MKNYIVLFIHSSIHQANYSIMSYYIVNNTNTQNALLMQNLNEFYSNKVNLTRMLNIINGESKISLRIVDWFVTNYAKKYYTVYNIQVPTIVPRINEDGTVESFETQRFKVYNDYKLKLKAYSKKRFDPFCRWERISIPHENNKYIETTIGQLNFFKWAIENNILDYIEENREAIEADMNARNSTSLRNRSLKSSHENNSATPSSATTSTNTSASASTISNANTKTRKKREELSVSACKCIKKEVVKIVVKFN